MPTQRMTMAQALVAYLKQQYVERDGVEHRFFHGAWGIFGHGCIAGIGQALQQHPDFRYYQTKNEQASVHIAAAFAKTKNRMGTFACLSSIGPGATNMITGAAMATVNPPACCCQHDIFSQRSIAPVLQQLESEMGQDVSVNDCFKPVSQDRINRPDRSLLRGEAMRVLTSPAETGAVTLALPQDVRLGPTITSQRCSRKRVALCPA
ncbi:MAG: thiamine pyrophosphate-binding protein [Bryobacteraceae bacterium]